MIAPFWPAELVPYRSPNFIAYLAAGTAAIGGAYACALTVLAGWGGWRKRVALTAAAVAFLGLGLCLISHAASLILAYNHPIITTS